MALITYTLLVLFALAPSLTWLVFYLKKDAHPEPNRMIIKIFLMGMLVALPAIYIEKYLDGFFSGFFLPGTVFLFTYFLLGVGLVEEFLKYLVVRLGALSSSALDEPADVMIYMITAGLGFAALENILLLFNLSAQMYPAADVFLVNSIRFVQAVFLHALVSGLLGYFLALSLLHKKHRSFFFLFGLGSATALHGLFNFYIFVIGAQNLFFLFLPVIPLLGLAAFISSAFRKLKNIKPSTM